MLAFAWKAFIPAWSSLNSDFANYYLAARLYRQGYPIERVYDWVWFQRQKDHAGVERPHVSFDPNPPTCVLPVLPLSSLPPLAAKRCWLLVNLALLGSVGLLLNGITQLGPRRTAIVIFLSLDALRMNFLYGQYHLLVAFLLALAACLYLRGWPAMSGAALAFAAALKIYPALFLFYFVRKKQWRAIAGLLSCSLGLGLLWLALFGFESLRYYVVDVLPRGSAGETIDPYSVDWSSFTALFRRMFIREPELNPHPLVHLPIGYAVLQPLCQGLLFVPGLWLISSRRVEPTREKLEWGTYIVLLLILSTNPASYHFYALIVAAALAADHFLGCAQRAKAYALAALYALVCFPVRHFRLGPLSTGQTLLAYHRLAALTALWIFLLVALAGPAAESFRSRLKAREAAVFVLIFLGLVIAGVGTNLRHLQGLFDNYASRLLATADSIIGMEPAVAGDEVFFTTMVPSGYSVASWNRGSLAHITLGADAFHPAVSGSGAGWVELASTTSRVVRLPLREPGPGTGLPAEAEDAEQPAVSPDGKWLLFVREARGGGSLWIKELQPATDGPRVPNAEAQVVGNQYGVLDAAFFPDHRIVFAARPSGSSRLFVFDPRTWRVSPLPISPQPIRYPAVSPDGQWLAYSQDEQGNWRLWAMRLSTGETQRLTGGDCNSITPAWFADSKTLVYATDCGRALGLTALCRIRAVP